jgi:hypothetical protein
MKLNIRTAKTKLYQNATVYYVPSKSGGDEHIVVSTSKGLFCDCKDFMTRRLPLIGTAGFTMCTHGKQVQVFAAGIRLTPKPTPKKLYGVFRDTKGEYRSKDIPQTFTTKRAAQDAIRRYERYYPTNFAVNRTVHAL